MKRLLADLEMLPGGPVLLNQEVTTVLSMFCEKFERRVLDIDTISKQGYVKVTFSDGSIGYGYIDTDQNVLIEIENFFQLTVFTFSRFDDTWQFVCHQQFDIASTLTPSAAQLAPRIAVQTSAV